MSGDIDCGVCQVRDARHVEEVYAMSDAYGTPVETRVNRQYTPPLTDDDIHRVRRRTRLDILRSPNAGIPGGQAFGAQRVSFPGIDASHSRSFLILIPPGQVTPEHNSLVEHIIIGLEGAATEWEFDGERHVLAQYDHLFIPARIFYNYRNIGLSPALVLAIISPQGQGWPGADEYQTYLDLPSGQNAERNA
jgi:quercetin dioxygenase-like cupin family protein